jgi:drug/metabolite transporter (DMT)-like permease
MINKGGSSNRRGILWLIYAFGAFFCWGFLALISKYLIGQGVSIVIFLTYLSLFVSLIILGEIFVKRTKFDLSGQQNWLLVAIGIGGAFFNLFMQLGYKTAPNPGYINAVNASSISMVTLLAAWLFKDELTLRKIIGVTGVTVGLILLFL